VVDVFEEVEEQLRSERYRQLARKAWPYLAALVLAGLLVFGGIWGYAAFQQSQSARASEIYAQAASAVAADDRAEAARLFGELGDSGPRTYRALALMQLAALRTDAGEMDEAISLFDQAAGIAREPIVQDAARLKAAYLVFDTASIEDLRARLDPLAEAGRPYAALAREAVAMKQLVAGQTAEARSAFSALSLLPDASDDLRSRAQAAVALIDSGSAEILSEVVELAAALPAPADPAPVAVGSAPPTGAGGSSPASSSTGEPQ